MLPQVVVFVIECLPSLVNCYVPPFLFCTKWHKHDHSSFQWFRVDSHMQGLMSCIALPGDTKPCIMPPFNSDAFIIGVDNHASRCMNANVNHFTKLQHPKQKVDTKGITDGLTIKAFGTIHWNITDDQGRIHHVAIDDSAFIPVLPLALLSPQHWSQQANNHFPMTHGTIMEQYSHECKL